MNEIEKIKIEMADLKNINENKSEMISVTAHQLRTSLSALKWILKMFLDKDFGEINKEQKDYLEKAVTSNERSLTLVNYLLTFNNSENIYATLDFKEINILNTLEDVVSLFYGELKNKNITLSVHKPEYNLPSINGDKEMLTVVFQNLIENAIKYSFENEKINISIKNDTSLNGVLLSIHNNGIEIKKDDKIKIFNKFFRAPNAIEKEKNGSGLGLFTAKSVIEKHNGKMWFESSKEEGTTFFVLLPLR